MAKAKPYSRLETLALLPRSKRLTKSLELILSWRLRYTVERRTRPRWMYGRWA